LKAIPFSRRYILRGKKKIQLKLTQGDFLKRSKQKQKKKTDEERLS
jgi:hypothetical protein